MSLVTRCPVCGTAFRVQSSQLAAHSGTVRCGKCGGVFNGVAALVEEDERVSLELSPQLGLFDPSRAAAPPERTTGDEPLPDFLVDEPPSRRARWLWAFAALVALCAMSGQAAYRFRAQIGAASPQSRESLRAFCGVLG